LTTSTTLRTIILALVANPEVQKKAQAELDRVVGTERTPTLADFDNLPYVQAIINEVQRWRPAIPLGLPHVTMADETYKGFVIPKGSTFLMNIWGIYHDPEVYEDPEAFNPDRFMESEFGTKAGPAREDDKDRRNNLVFGAGRRLCVGMHLGNNSVRINTMNLLWAFDFLKAKDALGKDVEPDVWDFKRGIVIAPNHFKCIIKPRSQHHADIIEKNFADATSAFEPFEQELCAEDRAFVNETRKAQI